MMTAEKLLEVTDLYAEDVRTGQIHEDHQQLMDWLMEAHSSMVALEKRVSDRDEVVLVLMQMHGALAAMGVRLDGLKW
jgi:hypothetical protein